MPKPTQDEVDKEVETLREQIKTVRPYSAFGDDNVAQIKAQIRVAEEDMDDDDIYDGFDDEEEQSSAFEMRSWLDEGDTGDGPPSEGWATLC